MSVRVIVWGLIFVTMAVALGQAVVGAPPDTREDMGSWRASSDHDEAPFTPDRPGPEVGPGAPWWVGWSRDGNGNRIDDDLERDLSTSDARYDVFVRFARTPDEADLGAAVLAAEAPGRLFPLAEAVYLVGVEPASFSALLRLPGVVAIERERHVVPTLDVASPTSMVTFSPELGNGARARWKVLGRGAVIAVLDTGIDQEHEAFDRKLFLGGYDATIPTGSLRDRLFTADPLRSLNLTTDTPLSEVDPDDLDGHGTPVAGIAFGVDPNGTYHGVASAAKFLDVKVIRGDGLDIRSDLPTGIGSMVIEGLEFVHRYNQGRTHLGDPGNDTVDIVTMSLAETQPDMRGDSTLAHAVNRLVDTGVVVVAAAGNCGSTSTCEKRGSDTIAAPGSARQAITVGAYRDGNTIGWTDDVIDTNSSQGPNGGEPKPNVVAPGYDIVAPLGAEEEDARATNGYDNVTGTSAAAPLVAGVVALMLEADPTMQPVDVKRLLMDSARDMGDSGWDAASGAGAVRAYLAVGVALGFIALESDTLDQYGREVDLRVDVNETDDNASKPEVQNQPPDVRFEFAPDRALPGDVVVFIDRSNDREGHAMVAFNWDFGDGSTAKGDRAAHAYDQPGEYVVRLSVTDVHGLVGYARQTVVVEVPVGETKESAAPPVAPLALLLVLLAVATRASRRRTL